MTNKANELSLACLAAAYLCEGVALTREQEDRLDLLASQLKSSKHKDESTVEDLIDYISQVVSKHVNILNEATN